MRVLPVFILLLLLSASCFPEKPFFDATLLPSIGDKELDFWFYTPAGTGPEIPIVEKVYRNQMFMLLMFCRAEAAEFQTRLEISYDIKITAPDGKILIEEKNQPYYKGDVIPAIILSNESVLEIGFDEAESFGTYTIEAVFHENVSNRSYRTSAEVELVDFTKPQTFNTLDEYSDWMMNYHRRPDPIRCFWGILNHVETSSKWVKDNLMSMAFYRRIFLDNPFLWEYYAKLYQTVSNEDKQKMLQVAAVISAEEKNVLLKEVTGDMKSFYDEACKIVIPDTTCNITTGTQLDILWAEFFASGTYTPIKRIVSALEFKRYSETLNKLKNKEIAVEDTNEKDVMMGAVYMAAEWSLTSNCAQFHRVRQYCQTVYERENLMPEIKKSLAFIIAAADYKKKDEVKDKQKADPNNG